MKNQKLNVTSLKKTPNPTKLTNGLSSFQNPKQDTVYLLPNIDKKISNTAYYTPTSLLTKYISEHAQLIIKRTEEEIKKPLISKKRLKSITSFQKYTKNLKNVFQSRNKTVSNGMNFTDNSKEEKKSNRFYMTQQKDISMKSKTNTEFSKKNSTSSINNIETEYNKSKNTNTNTNRNVITNANINQKEGRFLPFRGIKRRYESSMSLDREISKEKAQFLNTAFRRIRTYQPKIEENWKSIYGLTVNIGGMTPNIFTDNSIEYQTKLFNDHYNLLIDNINYYKMNILTKENYLEAFKCLSLKNKISYNQALEELCGILYILPQLILVEFYKYIQKFDGLEIPNKKQFKQKFIFDETSCLLYNNKLFTEVSEFFQNCYEVYLILVKEVDNMSLKTQTFKNVILAFEKARYDICFACNMAENALNNYNKDLNYINRLNRLDLVGKKLTKKDFNDKLRIYTRNNININKKNSERQKKLRIEHCLTTKEDEILKNKNKDFRFSKDKKITEKGNKFRSILDTELITKILKHCKKDVKYQINTQRINHEMDESSSGEEEKTKNTHQVIKLNF